MISEDEELWDPEGVLSDKPKPLLFTTFGTNILPTSKLMHEKASPHGASLESKRANSRLCSKGIYLPPLIPSIPWIHDDIYPEVDNLFKICDLKLLPR